MPIYYNTNDFRNALQAFGKKVEERYEGLIRALLVGLIYKVAHATPIDTGRAAGSWSVSRNHPGTFVIPEGQHSSPDEAVARVLAMSFKNPYVTWYIYNNVPYIERLEYEGWSDQAPQGMLRLSLMAIERDIGGFLNRAL